MNARKVLTYLAIAIGVLVLASVAISIVSALVSLVWSILTTAATILVLVGIGYGIVKGVQWLRSDDGTDAKTTSPSADPVERATERYVKGELSEEELERRLELDLGGPDEDEIDRELERSRSK